MIEAILTNIIVGVLTPLLIEYFRRLFGWHKSAEKAQKKESAPAPASSAVEQAALPNEEVTIPTQPAPPTPAPAPHPPTTKDSKIGFALRVLFSLILGFFGSAFAAAFLEEAGHEEIVFGDSMMIFLMMICSGVAYLLLIRFKK